MSDLEGGSVDNGLGVGFARVLSGASSFRDSGIENINETYRGQIYTENHETRFAIIKDVPAKELANEIMGAAAAKALGLPVPPAYIAFIPQGELEVKHAPSIDGGNVVFASCDVEEPFVASILRRGSFSRTVIRRVVDILLRGDLAGVFEFDTWSANVDRHPGNLLLSGSGAFWLIDQGYCFSGPKWVPSDLVADAAFTNRLKDWVTPNLSKNEVDALMGSIGAISSKAGEIDLREVGKRVRVPDLIGDDDFEALLAFLAGRLPEVRRLTADALGRLI